MRTVTDPARIRENVRVRLAGLTLQAVENATRHAASWQNAVEAAAYPGSRYRDLEREARAETEVTEYQRILTLMRERRWDIYDVVFDTEAK
jgi:hypothetical protein